jgi:hypothetical protein
LALVIHDRAVLGGNFRVGISEQFEVEPFLRAKIFVGLRGVDAYSEDNCAGITIFRDVSLKIARLQRATACEILGIEIKNHPFTVIIFQAHLRTVSGGETKIRRGLTDFGLRLRFCCCHAGERRKAYDR